MQNCLHNMTFAIEDYGLEDVVDANVLTSKFLLNTDSLRMNKGIFYNKILA